MLSRFLRAVRYHGRDTDTQLLARQLSDQLLSLAKNPLIDGMLIQSVDFLKTASDSEKTYPLTHQMGMKAQGVLIVECRPKDGASLEPTAYPTHCPGKDTVDIAWLAMTPYMAENFLWTVWVW